MSSAAPAITKRAAALPPEERRAAIIEAVLPLFAEHGETVTSRQIACAAGIAEGTVFRAFTDKDELLDAALDAALDQGPLEDALRAIDPSLPFEQRLVVATELIQRRVVDVWTLVSHLSPSRYERMRRPMTDSPALEELFATHADQLRVEPARAARTLRALTLALTHPMMAGSDTPPDEIVTTLLCGVQR
jgi:AcrR family transcriptional regulator